MTITEALAEIKLIDAKVEKQRLSIRTFLTRPEALKDPLAKDGGSEKYIAETFQSIKDLEERKVRLRRAIAQANEETTVTVGKTTKSIADWLVWRREVAPTRQVFLTQVRQTIDAARREAASRLTQVTVNGSVTNVPQEIVVNLSEVLLAEETEQVSDILATLDGQLSLKNATVSIAA
jgi:hypothetical protein